MSPVRAAGKAVEDCGWDLMSDDGEILLTGTLNTLGARFIATPTLSECHLRMWLADWARVQVELDGRVLGDGHIAARLHGSRAGC